MAPRLVYALVARRHDGVPLAETALVDGNFDVVAGELLQKVGAQADALSHCPCKEVARQVNGNFNAAPASCCRGRITHSMPGYRHQQQRA